ncbi:MAG: hypothetical protein QF645_02650 [Planctomycetota bacterium]|jgi:hypothetical protein|nr:hypothetical protein [Planctomycetota bacterium]
MFVLRKGENESVEYLEPRSGILWITLIICALSLLSYEILDFPGTDDFFKLFRESGKETPDLFPEVFRRLRWHLATWFGVGGLIWAVVRIFPTSFLQGIPAALLRRLLPAIPILIAYRIQFHPRKKMIRITRRGKTREIFAQKGKVTLKLHRPVPKSFLYFSVYYERGNSDSIPLYEFHAHLSQDISAELIQKTLAREDDADESAHTQAFYLAKQVRFYTTAIEIGKRAAKTLEVPFHDGIRKEEKAHNDLGRPLWTVPVSKPARKQNLLKFRKIPGGFRTRIPWVTPIYLILSTAFGISGVLLSLKMPVISPVAGTVGFWLLSLNLLLLLGGRYFLEIKSARTRIFYRCMGVSFLTLELETDRIETISYLHTGFVINSEERELSFDIQKPGTTEEMKLLKQQLHWMIRNVLLKLKKKSEIMK